MLDTCLYLLAGEGYRTEGLGKLWSYQIYRTKNNIKLALKLIFFLKYFALKFGLHNTY